MVKTNAATSFLTSAVVMFCVSSNTVFAKEMTVALENGVDVEMTSLMIELAGSGDWREALEYPLGPNEIQEIHFNSDYGCVYSFRARFSDGLERGMQNLDLCFFESDPITYLMKR